MHAFDDASEDIKQNKDINSAAELPSSATPSATDLSDTNENAAENAEKERKELASRLQFKVEGGEVRLQLLDEDDVEEHQKRMARMGSSREIGHAEAVQRN